MSRLVLRFVLTTALLAGALACGRAAFAGAASVEDLLAGGLVPSTAPALLGPITSVGRKGWDCKPEHAAMSAHWKGGELPVPPDSK